MTMSLLGMTPRTPSPTAEAHMSVTYVIRFDVIPEERDRFLGLLNDLLNAMRHEPNFREAVLHGDPVSSHRFMLYETWESHHDVLAVQSGRPYRQAWHIALPTLLRKPREVEVWRQLRVDRHASAGAGALARR
jgi:quinol monooxygenase YgiN